MEQKTLYFTHLAADVLDAFHNFELSAYKKILPSFDKQAQQLFERLARRFCGI
jgi:hypothetical protein